MMSSLTSTCHVTPLAPPPAVTATAGSLRKALKRKAFRPSAKWPFQTTYVSVVPWGCGAVWWRLGSGV